MLPWTATAQNTGWFLPGTDVAVAAKPYTVVTYDIDRDGDLDVLTPNFSNLDGTATNTVSIRLTKITPCGIIFENPYEITVGSQPRSLAVGDLNGDNTPDIVTANYADNTFSVVFNNGTGTSTGSFSGLTNYPAGTQPQTITLADLNLDGKLDVLCSNGTSSDVTVMLNNGAGVFTPAPGSPRTLGAGFFPFHILAADVNADGRVDLLAGDYQSTGNPDSVRVCLGTGNGSFTAGALVTVGAGPRQLALGDVNNDGHPDLFTANTYSNNMSVLINDGIGNFLGRTDFPTGANPTSVALGDINGDQRIDALVSNISNNNVTTYLGTGNGGFTISGANPVAGGLVSVGVQPNRGVLADMDKDGDLDLLTANFGGLNVSLRMNLNDLTVSTTSNICGSYRDVTVTSTGVATVTSRLSTARALVVNNGGTLNTACQTIDGPGSFTLAAGGSLSICNTAGITTSGATGAVQLTGTRSFSNDASYTYNGTAAQVTGSGLPSQVRNLSTTNNNAVTLTSAITVNQKLTVGGAGNFVLNGNNLTLPSSSTGTSLVVNSSTGVVQGTTVTVQRYIDPSVNSGLGYRHYSAPVSGSTVADLQTSGFTPVVNSAYNTSTTPGTTSPFPTVYGYDQSRLLTASPNSTTFSNSTEFDKGWFSPSALSNALTVGKGYTVNIKGNQLVDFAGTLNTGNYTLALARNSTGTDAGWGFVGNPYPSPIDWTQIAAADRVNLDAAMYVFESNGQYTGSFRSYVNGIGNPLIASCQGFFVRVSSGATTGSITFRNAQRVTSYTQQVPFRRGTADTRPIVELQVKGLQGASDNLVVYAQDGATTEADNEFDAQKIVSPKGINLASLTGNGTSLSINGLPEFRPGTEVALSLAVPASGTYVFSTLGVRNLPAGVVAYLVDVVTGQRTALNQQARYSCELVVPQGGQELLHRFVLRFGTAAAALATAPAQVAASVLLYPNPADSQLTVLLPRTADGASVQAALYNSLGQQVRKNITLASAGTPTTIDVSDLAKGVYTLRMQVGPSAVVKQVVLK